ncbi:MAG: hypothetical protein K8S98_09660 [Planctomycetes bacterium]|nr:hypothetical protein [Planctomycetota bacterium]
MRALLIVVFLVGAIAFFLSSTEDGTPRNPGAIWAKEEPTRAPEERMEQPMLATEVEADDDGHVTLFLGDADTSDEAEVRLAVTGRVIDPRGTAVDGLALDYRSNSQLGEERDTTQVRCDSAGGFSLQSTSTYAEFACEDSRWTLLFAGVEPAGSSTFHLILVAAPTTRCSGVVVDRAGHRIEGARVQATGRVEVPRMRNLTGHDFARRIDTNERGEFSLGQVPLLAPTSLSANASDVGSVQLDLISAEDRDLRLVLEGLQ